MKKFEIPVVLIIFKRKDTTLRILEIIAKIKPTRLYLLSDEGRNDNEKKLVSDTRKAVEEAINWECQVIRHYATENRGVYSNIGLGAKWVFETEKWAIFLEDDNLPEISFFKYCEELLYRYEKNDSILWICGTNYLGEYKNSTQDSYYFTQHLLPCGWASWGDKFIKYYDGELDLAQDKKALKKIKQTYSSRALFSQQFESINTELRRKIRGEKFASWDLQMAFSIRAYNKYGIAPTYNQIRNIGADEMSTHGGTSMELIMTERFCENPTYPLVFPLHHPTTITIDNIFEEKISDIILLPLTQRIKGKLNKILKIIFRIDIDASLTKEFKKKFK